MTDTIDAPDWSTIPAPVDDGASRHLSGVHVPTIELLATDGSGVDLASLAFGLSTQSTEYQREAAARLDLPFSLLSDEDLRLASAMRLPTFRTAGMTLLKRFTLVIDDGTVTHVFYPVFPPDQSAAEVIAWLNEAGQTSLP